MIHSIFRVHEGGGDSLLGSTRIVMPHHPPPLDIIITLFQKRAFKFQKKGSNEESLSSFLGTLRVTTVKLHWKGLKGIQTAKWGCPKYLKTNRRCDAFETFLFNRRNKSSDVDPDPVGSALIWVRGSGSAFRMRIRIQRTYKIRGKAEFNQQIYCFFFVGNYILYVWN